MSPYEEAAYAALMEIERRRLPDLGWQAHSVDLMRQLRAQGRRMTDIAAFLREHGIRDPLGRDWTAWRVAMLLGACAGKVLERQRERQRAYRELEKAR